MEKGDMAGAENPTLVVMTSGAVYVPPDSEERPGEEPDVVTSTMKPGCVDAGGSPVMLDGRDGVEDEVDGAVVAEVEADVVDMADGGGGDRSGGGGGTLGLGQARL
jgi:hypothetical protein